MAHKKTKVIDRFNTTVAFRDNLLYIRYFSYFLYGLFVCLCCGFMAQSTQWGRVEQGQFT